MKIKNVYVVQAGLIAALYFVLTLISNAMGLAFGPIQVRLSEILCILPVLTPAAIPGLAIGCAISNLASPYGLADILIGTSATLIATILTRLLRNVRIKDYTFAASLMPVICNALIVGAELTFFLADGEGAKATTFLITALEVGAGEFISVVILGLLLFYRLLQRPDISKIFEPLTDS